jgi:hypothetical protein
MMTDRTGENSPMCRKPHSDETKQRLREANLGENNPMYGKHLTDEAKQHLREINTGKKLTDEQCEKVRQSKLGKKREEFSDKWKAKMSEAHIGENNAMYGKSHSDDAKEKIRQKALNRTKKTCEHCGRDVTASMYARWHGDSCKMKK